MSRWTRSSAEDGDRLLGRSGSFSSSSASYYPIAGDGVEMDGHLPASATVQPSQAALAASASSAQPTAGHPFRLSPYPTAAQPAPSASPEPLPFTADPSSSSSSSSSASSSSSSPTPSGDASKFITISFRTLSGQVMSVTYPSLDGVTVASLKARLEEVHGIPVSFQRLIFSGRELTADDSQLLSYGMEDGSMVHLLLRQNQVPAGSPSSAPQVALDGEAGMGWFNGVSIPVAPAGEGVGVSEEDAERFVSTVRYSRTIKFLTMISVLGLLIIAVAEQAFMVGAVFGLMGYYGAHRYQPRLLLLYFVYIACSVAARIYFIVANPQPQSYVVFSFGIVLDLYLGKLAAHLYKLCLPLTPADRQELILLSRPTFNY